MRQNARGNLFGNGLPALDSIAQHHFRYEYEWIPGALAPTSAVEEMAALYSKHYGVWGQGSGREGQPIRLCPEASGMANGRFAYRNSQGSRKNCWLRDSRVDEASTTRSRLMGHAVCGSQRLSSARRGQGPSVHDMALQQPLRVGPGERKSLCSAPVGEGFARRAWVLRPAKSAGLRMTPGDSREVAAVASADDAHGGFDLDAEDAAAVFDHGIVAGGVSPGLGDHEAVFGGASHEAKLGPFAAEFAVLVGGGFGLVFSIWMSLDLVHEKGAAPSGCACVFSSVFSLAI